MTWHLVNENTCNINTPFPLIF